MNVERIINAMKQMQNSKQIFQELPHIHREYEYDWYDVKRNQSSRISPETDTQRLDDRPDRLRNYEGLVEYNHDISRNIWISGPHVRLAWE